LVEIRWLDQLDAKGQEVTDRLGGLRGSDASSAEALVNDVRYLGTKMGRRDDPLPCLGDISQEGLGVLREFLGEQPFGGDAGVSDDSVSQIRRRSAVPSRLGLSELKKERDGLRALGGACPESWPDARWHRFEAILLGG